jgi:hypothetical protein
MGQTSGTGAPRTGVACKAKRWRASLARQIYRAVITDGPGSVITDGAEAILEIDLGSMWERCLL